MWEHWLPSLQMGKQHTPSSAPAWVAGANHVLWIKGSNSLRRRKLHQLQMLWSLWWNNLHWSFLFKGFGHLGCRCGLRHRGTQGWSWVLPQLLVQLQASQGFCSEEEGNNICWHAKVWLLVTCRGFEASDNRSVVAKDVRLWVVTPCFNSAFFGKITPNGSGFRKESFMRH